MATAEEIRKKITDMMVKAIDEGTPPWRKPWAPGSNSGLPCNFQSGRRYTGINPLILMFWSMINDYESKFWGSSSAWLKHVGAHVIREQQATWVTLFNMIPKRDPKTKKLLKNKVGENIIVPIMRQFPLFNVQQLQAPTVENLLDGRCRAGAGSIVKTMLGIEDRKFRSEVTTEDELRSIAKKYLLVKDHPKSSVTREEIAEAINLGVKKSIARYMSTDVETNNEPDFSPAESFIKATNAKINYRGNRAFYSVDKDEITVPNKRKFVSMSDFYETVFHELVHHTQKEDRVGIRVQEDKDVQYAFNELVAEIGACLLLVELGVPMADNMLENSKSYVKNWLQSMKNDPKFIFDAATQAGKAVDYLLGFIGRQNPIYEETEDSVLNIQFDRAVA